MMDELKKLGFKEFVHLDITKRDGNKRMVWHGIYEEELIALVIILLDSKWVLEKVLLNRKGEEVYKYFEGDKSLRNVIDFVKAHQ